MTQDRFSPVSRPRDWRLLAWVLSVICAASARGQTTDTVQEAQKQLKPLALEIQTIARRTGAPIPVELHFTRAGKEPLLEGRLVLHFYDGMRKLGEYTTGEYALQKGVSPPYRATLPPMAVHDLNGFLEARAWFVTERQTIAIGAIQVAAPRADQWTFSIGVCDPWRGGGGTAAQQRFIKPLRIESYAPPDTLRSVATQVALLAPESMPTAAIGYVAYDMIAFLQEGFTQAPMAALEAAAQWIEAGGAAIIAPTGTLKPHHVEFLNRLADSSTQAMRFITDDRGQLPVPDGVANGLIRLRPGLGRAVVVTHPMNLDAHFTDVAWLDAVGFLWRWREDQLRRVIDGRQPFDMSRPAEDGSLYSQIQHGTFTLHEPPVGARVIDELMPDSVRVIPFGMIVLILALFVLAIGPGDYLLLGLIRRRKYTWIVFPLTAVAFTVFTVKLTQRYLGTESHERSVMFVDVGSDGEARRTTRYSMHFAASPLRLNREHRRELFTPVTAQRGGMSTQWDPAMQEEESDEEWTAPLAPVSLGGQYPVAYQVEQRIDQWSPQLNREMSFDVDPATLPIKPRWDRIDAAALRRVFDRAPYSADSIQAVIDGQPFDGVVRVYHGINRFEWIKGHATWSARRSRPVEVSGTEWDRFEEINVDDYVCDHPKRGLFTVMSRLSPNGSARFEDLSMLDSDDDRQWLIVIVHQHGDDRYVFRKLYHEGEP